jgi:hypothetical protein
MIARINVFWFEERGVTHHALTLRTVFFWGLICKIE